METALATTSEHDASKPSEDSFVNRELSWLQFAHRVLEMAQDPDMPLLERVKFAGILGMIYDEFVMKRMGGFRRQMERGKRHRSTDGLDPAQELSLCRDELNRQTKALTKLLEQELRPALAGIGVPLLDYESLDDERRSGVDRVCDETKSRQSHGDRRARSRRRDPTRTRCDSRRLRP